MSGRLLTMPEGCVMVRGLPERAVTIPEICHPPATPCTRLFWPLSSGSSPMNIAFTRWRRSLPRTPVKLRIPEILRVVDVREGIDGQIAPLGRRPLLNV